MEAVFLTILNMSIVSCYIALAVMVLRLLLKKAPKWILVLLWALVGVRLVCPFAPESIFSLIPSAETVPGAILYTDTPAIQSGIPVLDHSLSPILSESFSPGLGDSANPMQVVVFVLSLLWLMGIAVMLLYMALSFWKIHKKVKEAVPIRENIWSCDHVDTPFILGLIHPRIFLPSDLKGQDADLVIAHEKAHLKRRDHLWKPLGFLLLAVYWFHPLLWVAYALLCRDLELACDERVIRGMDAEQKKQYSHALIHCSLPRRAITACPLAFGEVDVKARVKAVVRYRKPAFWMILLALAVCAAALCFLTSPRAFHFREGEDEIVSASYVDKRSSAHSVAAALTPAQCQELASRLAGIKHAARGDGGADKTPLYQITARLQDGSSLQISGYEAAGTDPVHIAWKGKRYVVSDGDFQAYLSRVCAGEDVSGAAMQETESGENLQRLAERYPEYFGLDASEGLDVYVWQFAENQVSFGLLSHTASPRNWLSSELFSLSGSSAGEMRRILSSYHIPKKEIHIIPWQNPFSSYIGDYMVAAEGESLEEKQKDWIAQIEKMLFQ